MTSMIGIDESSRSAAADDDGTDQIGSDTPRSGVATPQPDLHDKRLPGIMSYFNQVRPASFKRVLSGTFTFPLRPSPASSRTPSTATIASPPSTACTANTSISPHVAISPTSTTAPFAPDNASGVVPPPGTDQGPDQEEPSAAQPPASEQLPAQPPTSLESDRDLTATPVIIDLFGTETPPLLPHEVMGQQQSAVDATVETQGQQSPLPPSENTPPSRTGSVVGGATTTAAAAAASAGASLHPYPTPPASIRGVTGSGSGSGGGGREEEEAGRKGGAAAASSNTPNPWDAPWTFRHKKSISDVPDVRGRQESSSTPLAGVVTPSSVLARHFSIPSVPLPPSSSSSTPASTRSPSMAPGGPHVATAPESLVHSEFPATDASALAVPRSASVGHLKRLTTMTRLKSGQSTPTRSLSTAHHPADSPSAAVVAVSDERARPEQSQGDETSRSRAASVTPTPAGAQAPAPKGKLTIKIAEARGLRRTRDPYVVAVFQRSELISSGPRHSEADDEPVGPGNAISSIPIQRQASDSGRPPMAIPMRSRQSSNTSVTDYAAFRNRSVRRSLTNPKWDAEAVLYV